MTNQKGFSLIELMIVIAIIGILASVAVPQYQDYVLRTDATNSLAVARPLQLAVGEYAARFSELPGDWDDLTGYTGINDDPESHSAGNIAEIDLSDDDLAVLTLTFKGTGDGVPAKLAGKTYELVPEINDNGVVTWSTSTSNVTNDDSLPELPIKYLPRTK